MNRFLASLLGFIAISLLSLSAGAGVNQGDKPQLDFTAVDGTHVSLKDLDGRIVIVDFWATWCGPCMQEAPHMVSLNQKFKDQGVQIIGISLDAQKQQMIDVARQSGFDWPQYFDGKGWKNDYAQAWGVNSIPQTFIISPDGVVLWRGHPAQIDAPLADAIAKHPVRLVDAHSLSLAKAALDAAEKALAQSNQAGAVQALSKVPANARKDKDTAGRIDGVQKQIEEYASGVMSQVDGLISAKQYDQAVPKLRELSKLSPMAVAAKANDELKKLMANPEARTAVAAAEKAQREEERAAKAEAALAAAQKLQAESKDAQAYAAFRNVAATYPNTPSASAAADEVSKYEKDPKFVKDVLSKVNDAKARSALSMAANYASAGRTDLAKEKYQAVIDQFPGTTWAEQARKEMAKLP